MPRSCRVVCDRADRKAENQADATIGKALSDSAQSASSADEPAPTIAAWYSGGVSTPVSARAHAATVSGNANVNVRPAPLTSVSSSPAAPSSLAASSPIKLVRKDVAAAADKSSALAVSTQSVPTAARFQGG